MRAACGGKKPAGDQLAIEHRQRRDRNIRVS